ncbi:hypothetical protein QKQ25_gp019 [Hyphantria cunea granulovirus]|uniref:Uncharacterized protein n=1 Tax=Hyphantria cunea granulovirus TaxID=307448 RepID=A0AAF1D256_9BBAC|nr:hypothetical protein QKQ25_gp019 [Hyphantria cunea granulovirus]QBQ01572.1 hypothetical protein HycuGV_00019 [Hyphantria cunea granulovirus]
MLSLDMLSNLITRSNKYLNRFVILNTYLNFAKPLITQFTCAILITLFVLIIFI